MYCLPCSSYVGVKHKGWSVTAYSLPTDDGPPSFSVSSVVYVCYFCFMFCFVLRSFVLLSFVLCFSLRVLFSFLLSFFCSISVSSFLALFFSFPFSFFLYFCLSFLLDDFLAFFQTFSQSSSPILLLQAVLYCLPFFLFFSPFRHRHFLFLLLLLLVSLLLVAVLFLFPSSSSSSSSFFFSFRPLIPFFRDREMSRSIQCCVTDDRDR